MKRANELPVPAAKKHHAATFLVVTELLSLELHLAVEETQKIVDELNLNEAQQAILASTDYLPDVVGALVLNPRQVDYLGKKLNISDETVLSVKTKYKIDTLTLTMGFLIDLHRYGISYQNNQMVCNVGNAKVAIPEPMFRRDSVDASKAAEEARFNKDSYAGYKTFDELHEKYIEKNHSPLKVLHYLLYKYQSGESAMSFDERLAREGGGAATDRFRRGGFVDVFNSDAMHVAYWDQVRRKMAAHHPTIRFRSYGMSQQDAETYAYGYIKIYQQQAWGVLEYLYRGWKNPYVDKNNLLKTNITTIKPIVVIPDDLKHEFASASQTRVELIDGLKTLLQHVGARGMYSYRKGAGVNSNNNNNNDNNNDIPEETDDHAAAAIEMLLFMHRNDNADPKPSGQKAFAPTGRK